LGGASKGFHQEGFECTGIDIVNVGYPYTFLLGDMRKLKGKDFQGYDVIWGSPPCRDFSPISHFSFKWKKPKNVMEGLELVRCFFRFIHYAKPRIWIMENVPQIELHLKLAKPRQVSWIGTPRKKRAFWGNYPNFLMPLQEGTPHMKTGKPFSPMRTWLRAKIPLACSLAFARACKTQLLEA